MSLVERTLKKMQESKAARGNDAATATPAAGAEITGDGNRFVVIDDVDVRIPFAGVVTRDTCAVVFEMRDGAITRIVIHHELAASLQPLPQRTSARRRATLDARTHGASRAA